MRKCGYLFLALTLLWFAPRASAQSGSDHIDVGIYGNFLRVSDTGIDLAGIGARVSLNIMPRVQLEAESGYNFAEAYSSGFSDFNGSVHTSRSQLRTLDGLFGPQILMNKGPVRLFATVKGGFFNANVSTSPAVTFGAVNSQFESANGTNTHAVFYPGGGAEAFWGPFGVRVDIGDEVIFGNSAHNNLRVTFGPTIRF